MSSPDLARLPTAADLPGRLRELLLADLSNLELALGVWGLGWWCAGAAWLGGSGSPWRSWTGHEVPKDRPPLLSLAEELWKQVPPDRQGLQALLGVVDPVANAISIAVAVNDRACAVSGSTLTDLIETWRRQVEQLEQQLVRAPALNVVFLGAPGPAQRRVRETVDQWMRQAGLLLPDLQVRWISAWGAGDPLEQLLTGHLPGPVWPALESRPSPQRVRMWRGQLQQLERSLVRPEAEPDVFGLVAQIQSIWAAIPNLVGSGGSEPVPSETMCPDPPRIVHLCLDARQWHGQPLSLPLATTTLVSSPNASGKTTLAEALSRVHGGLARPRASQPKGALVWHDRRAEGGEDRGEPSLTLERLGATSAPQARELLPLFADDADLASGTPGDLSVVSWLPVADDESSALARQLARVLQRGAVFVSDAEQRLASWEAAEEPSNEEAGASGEVRAAPWLLRAAREYADERVRQARETVANVERAGRDQEVGTRGYVEGLRKAGKELDAATFAELERGRLDQRELERRVQEELNVALMLRERLGRARTRLPLGVLTLPEELSDFFHWIYDPSYYVDLAERAEAWRDIRQVYWQRGRPDAVRAWGIRRARDGLRDLRSSVDELSRQLARVFASDESFRLRLDAFLSRAFSAEEEPELVRPNTARLVRLGQSHRLIRWLSAGNMSWPFVVIDEPTLGQDDAACAWTLARMLRLARKGEARRWAAAMAEHGAKLDEESRELDERTSQLKNRTEAEVRPALGQSRVPRLPTSAQTLVLSYRDAALSAVADLEGVVLDDHVVKHLRSLIPEAWVGAVLGGVRSAIARYRAWRGGDVRMSASLLAAMFPWSTSEEQFFLDGRRLREFDAEEHVLRERWDRKVRAARERDPTKELKKENADKFWREQAADALKGMGLYAVAAQLVDAGPSASEGALRLLLWMMAVDLVAAAIADAELAFELSGVCTRELPLCGGGPAQEVGPARLRRLSPCQQWLPPLPASWVKFLPMPEPQVALEQEPTSSRLGDLAERAESHPWRVLTPVDVPDPGGYRAAIQGAGLMAVTGDDGDADLEILIPAGTEAAMIVRGRGGEPDTVRPADLRDRLLRRRIGAIPRPIDADSPICVAVVSYSPDETPNVPLHFRYFLPPLGADGDDLKAAREREAHLGGSLTALQTALKAELTLGQRHLLLFPKCVPSAAVRLGLAFPETAGFDVASDQSGQTWVLDAPRGGEPLLVVAGEAGDDPSELHVLISISGDVTKDYQSWRTGAASRAPLMHARPAGGPARDAVSDGIVARAWAEQIAREISQRRPGSGTVLRLFVNAPNALNVALGRALRRAGELALMDFEPGRRRYRESIRVSGS